MAGQAFAPAVVAEEVEDPTVPEATKQTDLLEANIRTGAEASNFPTINRSVIVERAAADSTTAGMYLNLLRLSL
jgi:hypothetical protein